MEFYPKVLTHFLTCVYFGGYVRQAFAWIMNYAHSFKEMEGLIVP